jgi:hypothetical protein
MTATALVLFGFSVLCACGFPVSENTKNENSANESNGKLVYSIKYNQPWLAAIALYLKQKDNRTKTDVMLMENSACLSHLKSTECNRKQFKKREQHKYFSDGVLITPLNNL